MASNTDKTFTTPLDIPSDAKLTIQYRVRHPSRKTTRVYATINARVANRSRTETLGDFGRWYPAADGSWDQAKADAQTAIEQARLDLRTRKETAFSSFAELVAAPYTPTLSDKILADAYDAAGNGRKAYRR